MPSLSPNLLDLINKVIGGEASSDELVRQLQLIRQSQEDAPDPGAPDPVAPDPVAPDPVAPEHVARDPVADAARLPAGGHEVAKLTGATVDLGRQSRCGFGEVIFGEGKSADLVTRIIQAQLDAGQSSLVTRIDSGAAFQVRQSFQFAYHNPLARTLWVTKDKADRGEPLSEAQAASTIHAAVVTAGSTDAAVAEEAVETLAWMGVPYQQFEDIGVAGPQRLAAAIPRLRLASAVVVVAGMEGALPAVLAGHLAVPVFAVPTSVGYGASLGGLTPLMGMLSTCTASVAVVNIDGGFKGGYLAGMVVGQLQAQVNRHRPGSTGKSISEVAT